MKKYNKLLFSSLGASFEYYDLAIYSVFAVAIGHKFFEQTNTVSATLMVFMVYVVGFLIRPLGAWFFGLLADRKGRAYVLKLNMMLLFFSTFILAILPSIQTIGVTATIIFVLLRCVQAMAIGAEIPVAVIFSIEAYPNRKGLVTSLIFACLSFGIMMTSLVFYIITNYASDGFIANYGWRLGFLIGALFTLVLFFFRRDIDDAIAPTKPTEKVEEDFVSFSFKVIVGIMLIACIAMLTTQLYMLLPSYYEMNIGSNKHIASLLLIGSVIMSISCIVGGFISDYVSKTKMLAVLLITTIALAPIFYKSLLSGVGVYSNFIMLSIVMGLFAPTYNVIIVDFFGQHFRGRGHGLAYNLGYLIFSATIPAITIYLISQTNNLLIPAYMIIATAVISLVGLILAEIAIKK